MEVETIKKIIFEENVDFDKKEEGIVRDKLNKIEELKKIPHIIIISGLRRCGKSTLLKQIKSKLYPDKNNAYLNFENEKLFNFQIQEFDKIYESFLQLDEQNEVFFLDEIQNLENWEVAIRRLYEKKIKFYITGSNASLLSKELGTKLTGRHVNITLYPFSFKEYLKFNGIKLEEKSLYLTENIAKIKKYFDKYTKEGGIPEYLKYKNKEIIQNIYTDILYKDILVRYKLTDKKSLKELSKYLMSNIGRKFSYNKLKSMLLLGSVNTVKKYVDYLENSYLIFQLEKFDYSLKKQIVNQKKVYVIDPIFSSIVSFTFSQDIGRILENLVFLELKRREKEIYYHFEDYECDFVVKEGLEIIQAIQVTKSLSDLDTKKREFQGLLDALNTYKLNEGLMLTQDEEGEEIVEGKKVVIKPIWKWLLDKK